MLNFIYFNHSAGFKKKGGYFIRTPKSRLQANIIIKNVIIESQFR